MVNDKGWALRLPSDLYEQLVERAREDERSPAAVIRLLARSYVESPAGSEPNEGAEPDDDLATG